MPSSGLFSGSAGIPLAALNSIQMQVWSQQPFLALSVNGKGAPLEEDRAGEGAWPFSVVGSCPVDAAVPRSSSPPRYGRRGAPYIPEDMGRGADHRDHGLPRAARRLWAWIIYSCGMDRGENEGRPKATPGCACTRLAHRTHGRLPAHAHPLTDHTGNLPCVQSNIHRPLASPPPCKLATCGCCLSGTASAQERSPSG